MASFELALTPELRYRAELTMEQAAVEQLLSLAVNIDGISGLVSGKITSEGSLQDLHKLSANIKLGELDLDIFGQQVKNTKEIDLVITQQKLTVKSLELKGEELGLFVRGFLDFQGNFDLDLDGILDLRPVVAFLPETIGITSLAGRVQLICSVRGTFNEPEINGLAEINQGSVQVKAYPDPVTDIYGKLTFSKGKIEIVQIEGELSKGTFAAYGTLNHTGLTPESFSIDAEGKNLVVQDVIESLAVTVSPYIRISGDLNHQKLVGKIFVHDALYSQDIDFQAMIFNKNREIALTTLDVDSEENPLLLDLFIEAPKNIRINNKLADLDLKANLRVQGSLSIIEAFSLIQAVRFHPSDKRSVVCRFHFIIMPRLRKQWDCLLGSVQHGFSLEQS